MSLKLTLNRADHESAVAVTGVGATGSSVTAHHAGTGPSVGSVAAIMSVFGLVAAAVGTVFKRVVMQPKGAATSEVRNSQVRLYTENF